MHSPQGPFSAADLPLSPAGRIYHLDLLPEELAPNIIIVGDPERVSLIAQEFLDEIEVDRWHRGLHSVTGSVRQTGNRISLITSGMGTGTLEIVLNELALLNEVDFATRTRKRSFPPLTVVRVGTSGGLQAERELGTLIISPYAIGMDNSGLFYDVPSADSYCTELETRVRGSLESRYRTNARFANSVAPYVSRATPEVVAAVENAAIKRGYAHKLGITVSNSGFFAPQGRDLCRVLPTIPDIDEMFSALDTGNSKLLVENMEMESSFLFHFLAAHGYRVGTVCPVVANRRKDAFAQDIPEAIRKATMVALDALESLSDRA